MNAKYRFFSQYIETNKFQKMIFFFLAHKNTKTVCRKEEEKK